MSQSESEQRREIEDRSSLDLELPAWYRPKSARQARSSRRIWKKIALVGANPPQGLLGQANQALQARASRFPTSTSVRSGGRSISAYGLRMKSFASSRVYPGATSTKSLVQVIDRH